MVDFSFTGGALPSGATLTRASVATYVDNTGARQSAAVNGARFDYDYLTHASRGILIEPAATNQILYSNDITQAAEWTYFGVSAASATKFIEDNSNTIHRVVTPNNIAVTSDVPVVCSFIASEVAGSAKRYMTVLLNPGFAVAPVATFDLGAGLVTFTSGAVTAGIEATPGGWLAWFTSPPNTTTSISFRPSLNATNGTQAPYLGDGASGLNIREIQAEIGTVPSSRIRTTSAAATRAADVLTLNWAGRGVADGTTVVRYAFDDGSFQDITTAVAGGVAVVPTNLNRPRIVSATWINVIATPPQRTVTFSDIGSRSVAFSERGSRSVKV